MYCQIVLPLIFPENLVTVCAAGMSLFQTISHEFGHNMQMDHDFGMTETDIRYSSKGVKCTGSGGIMDYGRGKHQIPIAWLCSDGRVGYCYLINLEVMGLILEIVGTH